nr:putative ribonuclease H-like domain-containing protein [Tanacetum cinerariifolium]
MVVNSTTEAEYVVASSCCGQVLWIQNQLFDYGKGCLEWNGKPAKDEIGINLLLLVMVNAVEDEKKAIIFEASIWKDLRFGDEGEIDCFSNEVIFEQLTLIGVGKDFSGNITPLFPTMMVQAQKKIEHVADEAVNEEMDESLERATTTATSLDAEQDMG